MDKEHDIGYCSLIGAKGSSSENGSKTMTTTTKNQQTWQISIDVTTYNDVNHGVQEGMYQVSYEALHNYLQSVGMEYFVHGGSVVPKKVGA